MTTPQAPVGGAEPSANPSRMARATSSTGLRERKYLRTRAQLIETAVKMCLEVGYEKATVERISAAADISARTFSRYFASKEEVFLAVFDPVADAVVEELKKFPSPLAPLEALRVAHVAVFSRIADGRLGKPSADQVAVLLRVVSSSKALRTRAVEYRDDRVMALLANLAGVPLGDRRVELATTLFNLAVIAACVNPAHDTEAEPVNARALVERLQAALSDVAEVVAALGVEGP